MHLLLSLVSLGRGAPYWPANVLVNPGQDKIDEIYNEVGGNPSVNGEPEENGQWSDSRYALLFTPGDHTDVKVQVGYYTTVHGLGEKPTDTQMRVQSHPGSDQMGLASLDNFWRSAENFEMSPGAEDGGNMIWAVSQASPLRRVVINGQLLMCEVSQKDNPNYACGFASGGFMGDALVTGKVISGSQQQWISRNVQIGSWEGGVWNMVFVGCTGTVPATKCGKDGPNGQYTAVSETPVVAEKPFLVSTDGWAVMVPPIETGVSGPSWERGMTPARIPWSEVYMAVPTDIAGLTAAFANTAYNAIVLTPGIYYLTETLKITRAMTVLGIGMATVVPSGTSSAMIVEKGVTEARIAAILFQANTQTAGCAPTWVGNCGEYASVKLDQHNGMKTTPKECAAICAKVKDCAGFQIGVGGGSRHGDCLPVKSGCAAPKGGQAKWHYYDQAASDACLAVEDGVDTTPTEPLLVVNGPRTVLSDLFARVGGTEEPGQQARADIMLQVNSDNVILDNTWLWRADHTKNGLVKNSNNPCTSGIEVNGADFTSYGLAVEHVLGDMSVFNGEGAQTYFYQSELPYDVTEEYNYVSYVVNANVKTHHAYGVGTYSYFRDHPAHSPSGFSCPSTAKFTNALTVFLNGQGAVDHVINEEGDPTAPDVQTSFVCSYGQEDDHLEAFPKALDE